MSTLRATLAAAGIKRRPRQVHEYEETAFQKRCVGVLEDLQKIRRDFTFNAVNPVPGKSKAARGLAKGMGAKAGWPDLEIIFKGRFIGFELKKLGEKARANQVARHTEITLAGGTVFTTDTDKAFFEALVVIGLAQVGR